MPETFSELLAILESLPEGCKYRLVAGNTGTGLVHYTFSFTDAKTLKFFYKGLP